MDEQERFEPADIVTLDRVVCCYPDMPALIDASASRTRQTLGLVFPRENAVFRLGVACINLVQWLRRHPFRVFLHGAADVEARAASHGLTKRSHRHSILWQILVFSRPDATPAPTD